jgi:hypothetical protein
MGIISMQISILEIHLISSNMVMVREVEVGRLIGRVCHLLRTEIIGIGIGSKDGIGGIEIWV